MFQDMKGTTKIGMLVAVAGLTLTFGSILFLAPGEDAGWPFYVGWVLIVAGITGPAIASMFR